MINESVGTFALSIINRHQFLAVHIRLLPGLQFHTARAQHNFDSNWFLAQIC